MNREHLHSGESPENGNSIENEIADDLFWLEGRTWDELADYERQLIINSQVQPGNIEVEYVPNSAVSALIGLLYEGGVKDAANIDADYIRDVLGIEHTVSPDRIEECLARLVLKRGFEVFEGGQEEPRDIVLEDVVAELVDMKKEREYAEHVEDDIRYLKLIGVDPRQLDEMSQQSEEVRAEIHSLACDLRSPIARDIAEHYIRRNQKGRPVMRSFEDIVISVLARKNREARQKAELLEGNEVALRRAVEMLRELEETEEGREKLLRVMSVALASEEGRELWVALLETRGQMDEEKKSPTGSDDFDWRE